MRNERNLIREYMQSQSLYNSVYWIAMEAPDTFDVRQATADEMKELESSSDVGDPVDNLDNGEDSEDVNPIDNLDNGEDVDGVENGDENIDDPAANLDNGEGEEESTDPLADDPVEEDITENSDANDLDYQKRLMLHQNTIQLLDVIETNRDSFEQRFNNTISTTEQSQDYHQIIRTFDNIIEIAKDILKKKFMKSDYQTLMKYNVTITKVFDVIKRMVSNFMKQYYEENETKK